jgi:probable F420-dependent oxidoreductase
MTSFGLAVRNFVGPGEVPDIGEILRYSARAEELGFESLWAWDHILLGVQPHFPVLDSLTTLTAIAARTERIKLGTGVLVLPLRNPVVAAKVLASLDLVSSGRLLVGVAAGWYAREFDAVGIPYSQRGRIMDRNLDLIIRLWTEDQVTLQVDEMNLRSAVLAPRPVQQPRPPILVGGYAEAALRRAGQRGDGWLTYFYTADSFKRGWDRVLEFARAVGRDTRSLTSTNQIAIAVGEALQQPFREWLSTEWDTAGGSESTVEHGIRGSVDECVEQLLVHVRTGVDRLVLIPYRYQAEQVEILASEVLPRLRQAV